MYKMKLVKDKNSIKEFLSFPKRLYKEDRAYIAPLDKDIEAVFDQKQNKFFRNGSCQRWLCVDSNGNTLGKVAAFINKKYKQDQPTGGIGFFDCVENYEVACFMFDSCKEWLEANGMEAMDGPINFGERDKFWGLLVDGFTEPLYGMFYHKPYYKTYFEQYGFKVYFNQLCFSRTVNQGVSSTFINAYNRLKQHTDLEVRQFRKKELDKFAEDFASVYNQAWASHGQGKQLEAKQAKLIFKKMKPVMDERICWFVYEKEEPIAIWLNIPDLNQWFKYLNGKFSLYHKLKFLICKTFIKNTKIVGIVFGIIPRWQKKGVDGLMIKHGSDVITSQTSYKYYEMQWIGDFNPKMFKIAETLDTEASRRLVTYRYLFDRTQPYHRHPIL